MVSHTARDENLNQSLMISLNFVYICHYQDGSSLTGTNQHYATVLLMRSYVINAAKFSNRNLVLNIINYLKCYIMSALGLTTNWFMASSESRNSWTLLICSFVAIQPYKHASYSYVMAKYVLYIVAVLDVYGAEIMSAFTKRYGLRKRYQYIYIHIHQLQMSAQGHFEYRVCLETNKSYQHHHCTMLRTLQAARQLNCFFSI